MATHNNKTVSNELLYELLCQALQILDFRYKDWMDINETADFLSVKPDAVRAMVADGDLPYSKFRGRLRFSRADINNILRSSYRYTATQMEEFAQKWAARLKVMPDTRGRGDNLKMQREFMQNEMDPTKRDIL